MKINLKRGNEYSKLVCFGEENNLWIDKACAFFLAIAPILQHYKGIVEDAGITILVIFFPWILFRLLYKVLRHYTFRLSEVNIVIGLLFFILYRAFIHGISLFNLVYNVIMIFYFLAAATGNINIKYYIKTSANVAALACFSIILQYICHYILRFHLQLVPTSLLLPEADQWILGAQTGLAGITGRIGTLYRPSAFFLEPSHMFLYTFPHIFFTLFSSDLNKNKIKRAILLSLGLIFTTSGMGVLTVGGAWGAYFALTSGKANNFHLKNIFRAKNFLTVIILLVAVIVLTVSVPFIRQSVMRFLDSSDGGAIAGRTRLANDLLGTLTGTQLLFGVTNTLEGIEFNMSGFAATLYKFGLIGVLLSYSTYVIGLIKLKRQYFWISLLIIIVSFFSAQTHGTFYMMYYVFIILEGNYALKYEVGVNRTKSQNGVYRGEFQMRRL